MSVFLFFFFLLLCSWLLLFLPFCRCVVSRKGVAVDMSTDHKPEDDLELARIEKAGGAVVDGRVQVRACVTVLFASEACYDKLSKR